MRKPAPSAPLQPDVIRVIHQNGTDADCVVAVLGTLCGWTRDESLVRCAAVQPAVLEAGMTDAEIGRVFKANGLQVRRLSPGRSELDEDTGL